MLWHSFGMQFLAAAILAAVIAGVFAAAAWVLAAAVVRRLMHIPAPRRFHWVRRAVVALAAIGVLCILYGYFVEPYWLEVTHVRIATAKLAPGSRPLGIVHISDLHCDDTPRLEGKLPGVIAALRPDLIAFTGDGVNTLKGLARFRQVLTQLREQAPVFAVLGNWDRWGRRMDDALAAAGARKLDSEAVKMEIAGQELYLVGASAGKWPAVEQALATVPPGALTVVLFHYPDEIPAAAKLGVDLYLAGHTHGGQVALPFYGAVVTLSAHGKRFEAGLYHEGSMVAHVSRGIGMEGGFVPRVRFCSRPQVTLIELVPQDPSAPPAAPKGEPLP